MLNSVGSWPRGTMGEVMQRLSESGLSGMRWNRGGSHVFLRAAIQRIRRPSGFCATNSRCGSNVRWSHAPASVDRSIQPRRDGNVTDEATLASPIDGRNRPAPNAQPCSACRNTCTGHRNTRTDCRNTRTAHWNRRSACRDTCTAHRNTCTACRNRCAACRNACTALRNRCTARRNGRTAHRNTRATCRNTPGGSRTSGA